MATVSVRDLRNHGGDVLERVEAGESLTVTRDGRPVAQLSPVPGVALTSHELVARWSKLAPVDPASVRADIDAVFDLRAVPHPDAGG